MNFVALLLWNNSKSVASTSELFPWSATSIAAFKEANLLHELCVSSIMTRPGQRHKQSAAIRPRTQMSLPSIYSEFVAERWCTCQGREEGIGGRAEWSEIDAGCWRKLTAHGNWDLEIICYLSVKTRCEAIVDCCSCSPICRGPEWKWPVVQYVCVHVCVWSACRHCLAPCQIKKSTRAERLAVKLRIQAHADTCCLQVHFTGDDEDLWLIGLNF